MFPRSSAPNGWPAYNNSHYPASSVPRYQNQGGGNRFYGPEQDKLPLYEWRPTPPTPPVRPSHTPNDNRGRKRQHSDYSPQVAKYPRLESYSRHYSPYPAVRNTLPPPPHPHRPHPPPPPPPLPHPPPYPNHAVAGPSRSDFSHFNSSSQASPQPRVPALPKSHNSLQAYARDELSGQMVELFEACQQQVSDLERKERVRAQLQQEIQRVYAVARLYLTGSSMNGLGCRSSDADLCLVIRGMKRPDPIHVLSTLQRLFRSLSYIERTQLIRAKVPILRFREKGSDLEFDLNVNNTVGIRNTFLLKSYANADLRIRPMILVVKKWAAYHHINDASKGTLSSYTLVLMVLHYLQTLNDPVLPSLQMDYPECFNPFLDIDTVPERPKNIPAYNSRNQSSLGELLLGFLKYYATSFRWDSLVISVREARALPKSTSQEWKNKFICIEEPFERNNVARAVHEKIKFDIIKAQFAESCRILQKWRDLNSIIPLEDIINKESSRR